MKQVFADTLYWVASITPGDPWYAPTLQAVAALGPVHLVTTEEVLVEFLSAYAGRGAYLRQKPSRPSELSWITPMSPCGRRHMSHL